MLIEDEFAFGVAVAGFDDQYDFFGIRGPFITISCLDTQIHSFNLVEVVANARYFHDVLSPICPRGGEDVLYFYNLIIPTYGFRPGRGL